MGSPGGPAYTVTEKQGIGRCLVAARDLDPLELILCESPAAIGPEEASDRLVCISCYVDLGKDLPEHRCQKCGLDLLCSQSCAESSPHAQLECNLLAARDLKDVRDPIKFSRALLPLRILLLRDADPGTFSKVWRLMDHVEDRRGREPAAVWEAYQANVVRYLREDLGLGDLLGDGDVNRSVGIIRTNGIATRNVLASVAGSSAPHPEARCVFPTVSLLSHACLCNARCVQKGDHVMEVRAQRKIWKGEEISISYTSLLTATPARRRLLSRNWCFWCSCKRCTDATECGTFLSALTCPLCPGGGGGNLLPQVAAMEEGEGGHPDYACDRCGAVKAGEEAREQEEKLEAGLNARLASATGAEVARAAEEMLSELLSSGLHPTHRLCMRAKSELIAHLGNVRGALYHELQDSQLERKAELCLEFLETFTKVDPGFTDWRGTTSFELAMTLTTRARRRLDSGAAPVGDFRSDLGRASEMLREAVVLLEVEEEGTHARSLAVRSRRHLTDLKDLIRFAEFLQ